jgi:phospholipid/cholesterol/gamma-HCH transport system permease protein
MTLTARIAGGLDHTGRVVQLLATALAYLFRGRARLVATLAETARIGFDSLPMVLLISSISGSVLALQTADKFAQTGALGYVGGLVSLAIVREIGPIFTAMTVGARAGTAIASELANMQISEQIAALQVLRISPERYLVLPRLLAAVISLPMLTLVAEATGIIGGMLIAKNTSNLHYSQYLDSVWLMLRPYDVWVSLIKAVVFGVILAGICCSMGLSTSGGASEVGRSATRAAVWTAIVVIIVDFLLTWIYFTGGDSFQSPAG